MTTQQTTPHLILVPGHWLGAWAWDEVAQHLSAAGHRATALTPPGLDPSDPDRATRTLDDQAAAIAQALADVNAQPDTHAVLVAHSGANGPVSLAVDHQPAAVRRVIWVDSGPVGPGAAFAPDFPAYPQGGPGLPLPPFEALGQQASLDGLSPEMLDRFRERAVPEPAGVLRQTVELTNGARLDVPETFVCSSFPSAQVRELARAGHPMFAEVARLTRAEFVNLPTGHWPMWSRPADLAQVIAEAAAHD